MEERAAKRIRPRSPTSQSNRPRPGSRSRSRSPGRHSHREHRGSKPRIGKGFKWKEKFDRNRPSEGDERSRKDQHIDRGYRNRYDERDRFDGRDKDKDRERHRESDGGGNYKENSSCYSRDNYQDNLRREGKESEEKHDRHQAHHSQESKETDAKIADKFGISKTSSASAPTSASKKLFQKSSSAPPRGNDLYMTVKVNDRLGTTTMVPCLPSDSIGDFKKLVAMRIGRRPHEIMLKRQGERPFRDMLTLEDYGVGNGAQLDLELDTGD